MADEEKVPLESIYTVDNTQTTIQHEGTKAVDSKDAKGLNSRSCPNEELDPPPASEAAEKSSSSPSSHPPRPQISGHRLHLLMLALCVALSQSTLESTIVGTSLVSISDALGGFERRDWVVSAYLLTFTGFLVVLARVGTQLGTKAVLLSSVAVFVAASALCGGAASSLDALVVYRALQGLGGAGVVANVMAAVADLVPRHKAARYVAAVAAVNGLSGVVGPVLGGVINVRGQWRWIFLFNVPLGTVAFVMIALLMPSTTSATDRSAVWRSLRAKVSRRSLARIDGVGAFLLLAASALLVFALEEGGTRYAWGSWAIVSTLTLALATLASFVAWELRLERRQAESETQPVFPMSLLRDRVLAGILLSSFFTGFPYVSLTVNIPQRAQAVDGAGPFVAGLTLLPMLVVSALFTPVAAVLLTRARTPPVAILAGAATLQLLGVALLCTLETTVTATPPQAPERAAQLGYEALVGAGIGANLTVLVMVAQAVAPAAGGARALMLAAIPQVRVLAGTVGVAVCASLLNNHVADALSDGDGGTPGAAANVSVAGLLADSLAGIDALPPDLQARVRTAFAQGYRRQFVALAGFSAAVLLSTLLMCNRRLIRRPTAEELRGDENEGDDAGGREERRKSTG